MAVDNTHFKGSWRPEEDEALKKAVGIHGEKNWSVVARHFNTLMGRHPNVGRAPKQCRSRFLQQLVPGIKTGEWTPEEEETLVEGHRQFGNQWTLISSMLPGRTETSVKNHYNCTARRKVPSDLSKMSVLQRYLATIGVINISGAGGGKGALARAALLHLEEDEETDEGCGGLSSQHQQVHQSCAADEDLQEQLQKHQLGSQHGQPKGSASWLRLELQSRSEESFGSNAAAAATAADAMGNTLQAPEPHSPAATGGSNNSSPAGNGAGGVAPGGQALLAFMMSAFMGAAQGSASSSSAAALSPSHLAAIARAMALSALAGPGLSDTPNHGLSTGPSPAGCLSVDCTAAAAAAQPNSPGGGQHSPAAKGSVEGPGASPAGGLPSPGSAMSDMSAVLTALTREGSGVQQSSAGVMAPSTPLWPSLLEQQLKAVAAAAASVAAGHQ
eukprot:gene1233-1573_t